MDLSDPIHQMWFHAYMRAMLDDNSGPGPSPSAWMVLASVIMIGGICLLVVLMEHRQRRGRK